MKNKELNPEILRYRNNKFSFNACILAIVFQCIAFIFVYKSLFINAAFYTGVDIIINILFLLFVFLASEKVKTYSVKWGYIIIFIGLINLIRIYTYIFSPFSGENIVGTVENSNVIISVISYCLVAVSLTFGGIVAIIRGKKLNEFMKLLKEGER